MVEIRVTTPDERRRVADLVSRSLLHAAPDDEQWGRSVPSWDDSDSLSAWDGTEPLGHVGAYRFETLVPGGAWLPTAGVARVGVSTTAKRRGVASGLMTRMLRDAAERGQVLSSLRASEAVIYGRFGYGIAGHGADVRFSPRVAGPIGGVAPGSMRILAPGEVLEVLGPLYDRIARRPGAIRRPAWMWERYYEHALTVGGDAEYVAVHADPDGVDDGFVHYRVKWDESASWDASAGVGEIADLFGETPAVDLALWAFLADIDLVNTWTSDERPVDDVVRLTIPNQRAFSLTNGGWDEQWLRLVDVDGALTARTYGPAAGTITVAIDDEVLPANTGVWSIDGNGAKRLGGVNPESADLLTDVATLAATYLGGFRWSALASAGRIRVNQPAALAVADALFLTPEAPFCGSFF
ncbi:MAG: enhanced intracellular survival protein Eis [Desertimonas sp.]